MFFNLAHRYLITIVLNLGRVGYAGQILFFIRPPDYSLKVGLEVFHVLNLHWGGKKALCFRYIF